MKKKCKSSSDGIENTQNFPSDELVNSVYQNLTDQLKGSLEYNASHILVNEEDQAKNILKILMQEKDFEDLQKSTL